MSPSRIFILRPVGTSLLMVAIMLVGMIAYRFLPLSALPEVDYPTIRVLTLYPGAGPEVMTSSITAPLERQFGQMPGLNQMSSTCSGGASSITLQFDLKLSIDIAEEQVQAAINADGNLLPADLPAPPIYAKVNPADAPILTLSVTSKTDPLTKVHDMVDSRLAQKISQIPGVGLVSLDGGQKPGVRIRANPTALAAYGLNIDDLRTTISNANVNTPKGNFDGPARAYTINANDQITDPKLFGDVVVAYRNGAPVRLRDVATVEEGQENNRLAAWMNTTQAVIINVPRQPGAHVMDVVDAIVMIQNIARYIERGEDPKEASLRGSRQIAFTVVSLTVSLIAVLIPLLFMSDVVGRLFSEFAVTLSVTILISAVVSLTLTPMMCAKLLRPRDAVRRGRFYRASEHAFERIIHRY